MVFRQFFHIIFNVLSVGRNHGTVEMVSCLRRLVPLIRNAGIEDQFDPLLN